MPNMIKDGAGNGFLAKVDYQHRLFTRATAIPIRADKASIGEAFVAGMDRMPITATKGLIGWLYNTDDSRYIVIPQVTISWNGGDTNHNRCVEIDFAAGDGLPSGGTKVLNARNLKSGDPNSLPATLLQWDGSSGTGMSGHSTANHADISFLNFAQGYSTVDTQGAFLVAPKTTISLYARGEEAGKVACAVWAYILNPDYDQLS